VEDKVLVAGIDMAGRIPRLAYWYTADASEPQIYENDAETLYSGDVSVFLTRVLTKLDAEYFSSICIATDVLTETVINDITAKINGIYPDTKLSFISRAESIAHYSLNQKKELRINDVAFFEFDEAGLVYNRFHTANSNGKVNVLVESRDCKDIINLEKLENEDTVALDESFKRLINELFDKQHVSTVYLTGKGFVNEEWAKDSLNMLCNKRRVFKGQNLYAMGACYYNLVRDDEYRIVCDGRTAYETCLEVIYKEEKKEAVLIPAGKFCHEVGDVIVEGIVSGDQTKLVFIRRAVFGKEVIREEIDLSDIKDFKDRRLRIMLTLRVINDRELLVIAEDAGFGVFAKKTGFRVEKILGNA